MAEKGLKKFFTGLKKKPEKKTPVTEKKEKQKKSVKKKTSLPTEDKTSTEKSVPVTKKPAKKASKKVLPVNPDVLIRPLITEKATDLQSQNCYVFEVGPRANKVIIKRAVEKRRIFFIAGKDGFGYIKVGKNRDSG
ncbi:MAG: 50S ribosomal protein L23 [Bacteroidales bacterium]